MKGTLKQIVGPSRWGWALLLVMITAVAAALRLWQLGDLPPGLYRDEAFNGLDALGVLEGDLAVFFTANNGREPLYIYLSAFFVALSGRSVLALRLGAAVIGILTTLLTYRLADAWFGRAAGLLAAWLWATTLWAVHLSRLGLRPILLPAALALTFWLGTLAYQKQERRLWLLAGFAYGLSFYTYLAVRFTPILLILLIAYLAWRDDWRKLWPGVLWAGLAAAVVLLPLALFYVRQPELLLGRTGQVSILNPEVNHDDLWGTLWRQIGRALGLFVWQGDTILRHNPAGRPLFDGLMALPFLIGVGWSLWHWRRPAAMILLLWTAVMLGPTILAEDAPHFLRAVGILPAAVIFPALGLRQLWRWELPPRWLRRALVLLILIGSALITWRDYGAYVQQPDVALLFEAAATELAQEIKNEAPDTAVYLDRWFWDEAGQRGWPSIPFLADLSRVRFYRPELLNNVSRQNLPVSIYAWPFGDLSFVPQLLPPDALVAVTQGPPARGDLETESYPLYVRYHAQDTPATVWPDPVQFGDGLQLRQGTAALIDAQTVQVDLYWSSATAVPLQQIVFIHVLGPDGLIGQSDKVIAGGHWLPDWWQPEQIIHERRRLRLERPFDPAQHTIQVGVYDAVTLDRLPAQNKQRQSIGDSWTLPSP